jgi:hypothetical protein
MTQQPDPELTQHVPAAAIPRREPGPFLGQHQPVSPLGPAALPGQGVWPPPRPRGQAPPAWPTTATPGYTPHPSTGPAITAAARRGPSRPRGRWIAAAVGAALVLIGGSVAITLALDGGGSAAAPAAPAADHHIAAAPAQVGEPTVTALLTGYVNAINHQQGETLGRFLCGGTGPAADSATGLSWTFIMMNEQVAAGQAQTGAHTAVPLTVSFRGQPSLSYLAVLAQQHGLWCLQGITSGGGQ